MFSIYMYRNQFWTEYQLWLSATVKQSKSISPRFMSVKLILILAQNENCKKKGNNIKLLCVCAVALYPIHTYINTIYFFHSFYALNSILQNWIYKCIVCYVKVCVENIYKLQQITYSRIEFWTSINCSIDENGLW